MIQNDFPKGLQKVESKEPSNEVLEMHLKRKRKPKTTSSVYPSKLNVRPQKCSFKITMHPRPTNIKVSSSKHLQFTSLRNCTRVPFPTRFPSSIQPTNLNHLLIGLRFVISPTTCIFIWDILLGGGWFTNPCEHHFTAIQFTAPRSLGPVASNFSISFRNSSESMMPPQQAGGMEGELGVEPKIGGKNPKWMVKIMENPIKMDDLGGPPLFLETPN